ncbi:MAG: MarR family transcriptional regulator [Sandaracinus sp.]
MTHPRTPRLDDQLCFALYSASRAFSRAYAPLLAELGLTYPQYVAMLVLWEQDDLSVSELGARLALDSGTLTPLLKRLEEQGLVRRARDPEDERVLRIRLTPAGEKLSEKAAEVPAALACRVGPDGGVHDLSQIRVLRDAVKQLTRALDASVSSPAMPATIANAPRRPRKAPAR